MTEWILGFLSASKLRNNPIYKANDIERILRSYINSEFQGEEVFKFCTLRRGQAERSPDSCLSEPMAEYGNLSEIKRRSSQIYDRLRGLKVDDFVKMVY